MPAIAIVLFQLLCGVHAVRSGQDRYWLYIIIFLPGIGCAVYALSILLPDLFGSYGGRKLIRQVHNKINPERDLRALKDELIIADTSHNRLLLADELMRLGHALESIEHYQKALVNIFTYDPAIMLKLAHAQFDAGDTVGCQQTLETLIKENPKFQSQNGHLLYARALEKSGKLEEAESEYLALIEYFTGPEARFYYSHFLKAMDKKLEAKQQLETILMNARRSKAHYRRFHKEWIAKAKKELKEM